MKSLISHDFDMKTIGLYIAENIKSSFIFEQNGVKIYGNLSKTISEIKKDSDVNFSKLQHELSEMATCEDKVNVDFTSASTDSILDYIEHYHHKQIRDSLPIILKKGKEINEKLGQKFPQIAELYALTIAFSEDIFAHMDMEEKKLFSFMRTYIHYEYDFPLIKNTFLEKIKIAIAEHEEGTGLLKAINRLSDGIIVPDENKSDLDEYLKLLESFVDGMYEHVYLENSILFPRFNS